MARDVLTDLLGRLGAETTALGRSDAFVPVDTEAHRQEDIDSIAAWCAGRAFDAVVSTDGDSDRPLIADETGSILRGDVIGLLTARYLGLGTIVTPVTSSSAIETSGIADHIIRTRVGSPFVIAGMDEAARDGRTDIVGFEANGGVLLYSDVEVAGRKLASLATRDAVLPILSVLAACRSAEKPLSALVEELGAGHAAAHRLQEVPASCSGPFLERLATDQAYRAALFEPVGEIASSNALDGVRVALASGEIVHFRASGNAPELRCYVEAGTPEAADKLLEWGLKRAAEEVGQDPA